MLITYVSKVLHYIEKVIRLLARVSHRVDGFSDDQILGNFGPHVLLSLLNLIAIVSGMFLVWADRPLALTYLKLSAPTAVSVHVDINVNLLGFVFSSSTTTSGNLLARDILNLANTHSLRLISISYVSLVGGGGGGEGGAGGGGGVGERALITPRCLLAWKVYALKRSTYRGQCVGDG